MMNFYILFRFSLEMRGAVHIEVNMHSAGMYTDILYTHIPWLRFFLLLLLSPFTAIKELGDLIKQSVGRIFVKFFFHINL